MITAITRIHKVGLNPITRPIMPYNNTLKNRVPKIVSTLFFVLSPSIPITILVKNGNVSEIVTRAMAVFPLGKIRT